MFNRPFKAEDGPKLMLIAFVAMIAAQFIVSIILMAAMNFGNNAEEIVSYIGMLIFQATFLTAYLVYTKKHRIRSTFSPRNKITWWTIPAAILIGFICMLCFMGPAYYFDFLLMGIGYESSGMDITTTASLVLVIIATVIAAPICEETIYRSALLSGVVKTSINDVGASILCGICFALMHMNPEQTVYQFCLGAAAAYIAIKCRSVIPAMIIHSVSNAIAIILSFVQTSAVEAIDGFFMEVGHNILVTLLTCVLLPIIACVLIWLICKYLKKAEQKKYPDKYSDPKVVWIDENTFEPVYEGENVPEITEENRMVQKGFSPFTGAPVIVDRLELQNTLMEEYKKNDEESQNKRKKSYKVALAIYFGLTIFMWIVTFAANFIMQAVE